MNIPLAASLLGMGVGGLYAKMEGIKDPAALTFLLGRGAASGAFWGWMGESVANAYRAKKHREQLAATPDASQTDLRKLVQRFRRTGVDTPVYVQTGGTPFENAAYVQGNIAPLLQDSKWTNIETGKPLDTKKNLQESIIIGSRFRNLPTLAHELGHAKDLKGSIRPFVAGAIGLLGLGTGLVGTYQAFRMAMDNSYATKENMMTSGGLGLAAALLGVGAKEIMNYNERAASRNAMEMLQKVQKTKQLAASEKLLESAYNTYDPIQLNQETFMPGSNDRK